MRTSYEENKGEQNKYPEIILDKLYIALHLYSILAAYPETKVEDFDGFQKDCDELLLGIMRRLKDLTLSDQECDELLSIITKQESNKEVKLSLLKKIIDTDCEKLISVLKTADENLIDKQLIDERNRIKKNLAEYCGVYTAKKLFLPSHHKELDELKNNLAGSKTFIYDDVQHLLAAIEKYLTAKSRHESWVALSTCIYMKDSKHHTIPLLIKSLNEMMAVLVNLNSFSEIQRVQFILHLKYISTLSKIKSGSSYFYYNDTFSLQLAEVLNMLAEHIHKLDEHYYAAISTLAEEEKENSIEFMNTARSLLKENLAELISFLSETEYYEKILPILMQHQILLGKEYSSEDILKKPLKLTSG